MRFTALTLALALLPSAFSLAPPQPRNPVPAPTTPNPALDPRGNSGSPWNNWHGPPACQDTDKRTHCHEVGSDCNKHCECVPVQGCGEDAKCNCEDQGGWLDSDCHCHTGTPKPHNPRKRSNLNCPPRQTACQVESYMKSGSSSSALTRAWECIDTLSTLDSCGGCVSEGKGVDCTAIEGAEEVECVQGACEVMSCEKGWKVDIFGTGCERAEGEGRKIVQGALKGAEKFWGL